MRKVCLFLIVVLLLGCLAGCDEVPVVPAQPTESRPIENPDGTLSDWMKEEIDMAYQKSAMEKYGLLEYYTQSIWWDAETPLVDGLMYFGNYNGYVMYCNLSGMFAVMDKEIAGYQFHFSNIAFFHAYKAGEFYDLEELLEQGLIDEEAIRIAHEHYVEINKIKKAYREQQENS